MKWLYFFYSIIPMMLWSQDYSSFNISKDLFSNNNIIIRQESTVVTIDKIDEMEVSYSLTATILNKAGENSMRYVVDYTKNSPVTKLNLVLYDRNGKEIKKYSKKEFKDISNTEGYEISDTRFLYLSIEGSQFPYTANFTYTTKYSTTAFIPSFNTVNQEKTAIENQEYTITNLSGIPLKYKIYNEGNTSFTKNIEPQTYSFAFKDFKGTESEPYSPDFDEIYPNVSFTLEKFNLEGSTGNSTSWQDFGKWMYDSFLVPTSKVTPEMQAEFRNVVANSTTTKEKVEKLYQYLQGKMRYISIQLGIGGWKPTDPIKIHQLGYGDCKGLTNYLRAALQSIGIPSNYCVLYTTRQEKEDLDPDFPRMQGNHVILNVPVENENLWLECTSSLIAFNYITEHNDDRNVLIVNENGGKIVKTPKVAPSNNSEKINALINIDQNGNMNFNANFTYFGYQYEGFVDMGLKNANQKTEYLREKFDEIPGLSFTKFEFEISKNQALYNEEIEGNLKGFCRKVGPNLIFDALPYGKRSKTLASISERKFPFKINRGFYDDFTYVFQIPQGYKVAELPKNVDIADNKFGNYSLHFTVEGNTIKVERKTLRKEGNFQKTDYNDYVEFLNSVHQADLTKLMIEKI